MKWIISIIILGFYVSTFSQNHKIAQLLTTQLEKERRHFYDEVERKNFIVTEPFRVDENNILHFGFTIIKNAGAEKMSIKREVSLDKIVALDKDLHVYFQTLGNDVTETRVDYDKNAKEVRTITEQTHLFSTEISREHYPNRLMKRLAKAFKKVGYEVDAIF